MIAITGGRILTANGSEIAEGVVVIDGGTLLALNVTLTLKARLAQSRTSPSVPVQIIYNRSIRAAKTLRPAPLATGAGTVSPATP